MDDEDKFSHDSEDVREQLEQQRLLAAQLREKLEHDEQQLASKEQQNELLKSKLSLFKSRSKAKRSASTSEKDEQNTKLSVEHDSSHKSLDPNYTRRKQVLNSSSKGKMNILREQLEQNRLRFERHGIELSEDARSMEAMVEQLRHQLEERDVTIQQLQSGEVTSVPIIPELQGPESVDIATQLLQKEDQVKMLMAQLSDQQNMILELQENLKEKDCVIEARTQAISLLSEDMSKKWRVNVDMLEETRQQMQMMQENFVRIEAGLNSEIEQLNLQLSNTSKKLSQAEQNVKTAEVAYNDLVSQNAELIKEIQGLRELQKGGFGQEETNSKIEELKQALSEANKLTVKLKAEHKAKVKTLNKQIDSLRKESDSSDKLVQLQNHIAELEDEKGNLQLHLIEVEESTVMQEQKISELTQIISQLEIDLRERGKEQLTSQNTEEKTELNLKLEEKETEIKCLKQLIEKTDLSSGKESIDDLKHELEEVRSALEEWQCRYGEIEKQLLERNVSESQQVSNSKCSEQEATAQAHPPTFENGFIVQIEELRSKVAFYEDTLLNKVELLECAFHDKQLEVQELETIVQNCLAKIGNLSPNNRQENICGNMNQELIQKEVNSPEKTPQIMLMEISMAELKQENENLIAKLNDMPKESLGCKEHAGKQLSDEQYQESTTEIAPVDLQRELIEATGELALKKEECIKLESKLQAQAEKMKKIAISLKVKMVANKELEDRVSRYESLLQKNKEEIDQLSTEKQNILEKWQTEISEKDTALHQMAENLASRALDVQNLNQHLDSKSFSLQELEVKLMSLQKYAEELKLAIEEKSVLIERLSHVNAKQDTETDIEGIDRLQTEIVSLQSRLSSEMEEKQSAITKLETFTKQAKLKLAKEKKIRSDMIEKQNELVALIAAKTALLKTNDEEIEHWREENKRLQTLLKENENLAATLRQELEIERNKLQFANENIMTEDEHTEEAHDLHLTPSLETFQNEVENLCMSVTSASPQDVLPLLEEEKIKTMNELSCSFESLHTQIVKKLQNRPDLLAERKLFTELRNLVTRVLNRTTALESKIKNIIAESDSLIQRKLFDAEKSVEILEKTLAKTREHLHLKETEKNDLEVTVDNINKDHLNLHHQMQQESQKSLNLEIKLKETRDQLDALIQSINNLQQEVNEKELVIQDLQNKFRDVSVLNEQLQEELRIIQWQNRDLKMNLEKQEELQRAYHEVQQENESRELRLIATEEEVVKSKLRTEELESMLSEAMKKNEILQIAAQEVGETQRQIQVSSQLVEELKQQLAETLHSRSLLEHELSLKSDSYLQQNASWMLEKDQFESRISDLMNQLQQTLVVNTESTIPMETPIVHSEEVELLRKQLQDKSSELENYQRRLIQLQMGGTASNSELFEFSNDKLPPSEMIQFGDKLTDLEGPLQSKSNVSTSHIALDTFKPASSLFEASSEMTELHEKVHELTQQLEALSAEKKILETEKLSLQTNFDHVSKLLSAAQSDREAAEFDVNGFDDLKLKVTELTSSLERSQSCVEQEKITAEKLRNDFKEIQWKLENEKFNKEKAENELKALKEAERPSIPQTLDTHVSSLQKSGSAFDSKENRESLAVGRTDESLMESNITQLESELRGMVTSRREGALKEKTMEDCWNKSSKAGNSGTKEKDEVGDEVSGSEASKEIDSLQHEICNLKEKLTQLEVERNTALSQIEALQSQIQALPQSSDNASSTSQAVFSTSDPLMTEDDNWCWGSESAHLEVQHQEEKNQSHPHSIGISDLESKLELLKSDKESLEKENLQLSDDLKSAQIRAAKLTRKLRDVKAKYDELSDKNRSSDSPFDSLDQAIEEERMKQMLGLEKSLKDVHTELNTIKADRERLQKQVDVFSSANEQMLEAKERQDLEVEMWQKRSKDLSNQVLALEWRIRELEEGKEESITEEKETRDVHPTTAQSPDAMNPVEIEQLLKENHTWNSNYENLMQEYQKLRAQCLADSEQRTQVDVIMAQQKGMIERLEHEKAYFQDVYDSLKMDYEAACAQLALKETGENEKLQFERKTNDLEEKLFSTEQQLLETIAHHQSVSSENSELQARCSQLDEARKSLLHQLEESQKRLEVSAQEISRLHEKIRTFEKASTNQTAFFNNAPATYKENTEQFGQDSDSLQSPINDVFISHEVVPQGSSASSTVLNWSSVVPGGEHSSVDIFETIARKSSQDQEQLFIKEQEMQKDKRMIETLKRTHQEAEQEWSQIIEYHKSQNEAAQKTINDLQSQVESLKRHSTNNDENANLEHEFNNQMQINQQLQNVIFAKEKEIENLQRTLVKSEETKKKLEEELHKKEAQLTRLLDQNSTRLPQTLPSTEITPSNDNVVKNVQSVPSLNAAPINTANKNLSNELDLALTMLYERDVRCEELTQELTRLLEERDSLQLRLSNAIRSNEELRERLKHLPSQFDDFTQNNSGISQGPVQNVGDTHAENVNSSSPYGQGFIPEESSLNLENKLAELRKIGYSHDKWLRDDSEYRHQQQMRLLSPTPLSNSSIVSADLSEPNTLVELTSTSSTALDTTQNSSNTDLNSVEKSSSNDSQGSLLSWFWGRN